MTVTVLSIRIDQSNVTVLPIKERRNFCKSFSTFMDPGSRHVLEGSEVIRTFQINDGFGVSLWRLKQPVMSMSGRMHEHSTSTQLLFVKSSIFDSETHISSQSWSCSTRAIKSIMYRVAPSQMTNSSPPQAWGP